MEHKIFGAPEPGVTYRDRPGAYGVAFDGQGRAAVVCNPRKGCFLLGGGMEPGEDELACLRREVLEETGRTITIGEKVCVGEEYAADLRGLPFHPIGYIYLIELGDQISRPVETDHVLTWMPVDAFENATLLRYQSWALEMAWKHYNKLRKEKQS